MNMYTMSRRLFFASTQPRVDGIILIVLACHSPPLNYILLTCCGIMCCVIDIYDMNGCHVSPIESCCLFCDVDRDCESDLLR